MGGGWVGGGQEQSKETEQACGVFLNHNFASSTACMSAMFVAY